MDRPIGFSVGSLRVPPVCRPASLSILIVSVLLPGAAYAAPLSLSTSQTQAPLVAPTEPPGAAAVDLANGDLRATVARLRAGKASTAGVKVVDGRVNVEILSSLPQRTIAKYVSDVGGTIAGNVPGQLAEAYVPYGQLVSLEHRPGIDYIRPPLRLAPAMDGLTPTPRAEAITAASPVVGEEVAKTNASSWQTAGLTGLGVKIGIIDYFDKSLWDAAAANGDLPPAPTGAQTFCRMNGSVCNAFGFTGPGTEHGEAVAEIVHEQAPNAQLYLAFVFSISDMQDAVNYFATQGVKIITRSGQSEYDGPGDGTGQVASVLDSAVTQGMAFFQSAGNNAGPNGAGYGAYWRGSWTDANGNGYLDFSGTDEGMQFSCGVQINGFRWSDWGTPASNRTNYDVFVYDKVVGGVPTGLLASSTANQQTGAPPIEIPHYSCNASDPTDTLIVQRIAAGSGSAGDVLEWEQNGGSVEYWQNPYSAAQAGSDTASPGALTVGAIDPPNGTTIASYSSWGPTNDNRIKPDLSAASGVQNFTYGTFSGTSASTPAAAGAAALVLQSGLAATPTQLKNYLLNSATVDRGAAGSDNTYGRGELVLPEPSYARPRGATPMRVSLVPWFGQCGGPNRTHGAPLSYGSCAPPSSNSPYLTIGTPDSNGAAANFTGYVNFAVHAGIPGPPEDSDVNVTMKASDIRCRPASGVTACGSANAAGGADYTGQIFPLMLIRWTDRFNAPSGGSFTSPATVQDFTQSILAASCTATTSTTTGSDCSMTSSFNAVLPGTVLDGKRSIMEVSYLSVADGGSDGQANTGPNYYFLDQGVFVP